MRRRFFRTLTIIPAACLVCCLAETAATGNAAQSWQPGRVVSVTLSGYGPEEGNTAKHVRKGDVWWNYCISSNGRHYSALSRLSPAKAGLKNDSIIKLSERKNQLDIMNTYGKRITLRILRKDNDSGDRCP